MSPLRASRNDRTCAATVAALSVKQSSPHFGTSLSTDEKNRSTTPLPLAGLDSQNSSSADDPFTPASAAFAWHPRTPPINVAVAWATAFSHLAVVASGGRQPLSSSPN